MKNRIVLSASALSIALLLSACGSSDDTSDSGNQEAPATETVTQTVQPSLEAGEHTVNDPTSGAPITINFPADESAEAAPLKDYLSQIGAPADQMVFMTADIDNREGAEKFDPMEITMTDEEGNLYTFVKTSDILTEYEVSMEWPDDVEDPYYTDAQGNEIPEAQYDTLNSDGIDLYNESLNGVAPGERKTVVYVYDGSTGPGELPETFTNITVETAFGSASVGESAVADGGDVAGAQEGTNADGTVPEGQGGLDDAIADAGGSGDLDLNATPANLSGMSEDMVNETGVLAETYYPTLEDDSVWCAQSDPNVCYDQTKLEPVFEEYVMNELGEM